MKANLILHICAALAATATLASAQGGPLTPPPGAPAPGMKSLDQVEPRIPLVAGAPGVAIGAFATITISQPGSYYLTGNLQITGNADGIIINSSGVTIDLMGHSIIAPASGDAGYALLVNFNRTNIRIQNGHILSTTTFAGGSFTLSGFSGGIRAAVSNLNNISVSNITVRGSRGTGILVFGQGCIVENCSVFISGGRGIRNSNGTVVDSLVHTTGGTGIGASVASNCGVKNSLSYGISADAVSNSHAETVSITVDGIEATTVDNSVGITSGRHGISAITVSNSRGQSSSTSSGKHGISSANVTGSYGQASGGHGISATSVSNSVGTTSGANGTNSSGISADTVTASRGTVTNVAGGSGISGLYSVTASYGTSIGLQGIYSNNGPISDCYGSSTGSVSTSRGIDAAIITNSRGSSSNASGGAGVHATISAFNSTGTSAGGHGIYALRTAMNCYGTTSHTSTASHGIYSGASVNNSVGRSTGSGGGDGINALIVTNSYGWASVNARNGIDSTVAESSVGQRAGSNVAGKAGISADRASLCQSINGEIISFKYNMP